MKFLINILTPLTRYIISIHNLGLINTIKILFLKFFPSDEMSCLKTKKFGDIYWRSKIDYGVVGHFYNQQININTFGEEPEIILDIGANIGVETLRFNKLFPNSKIICVEPELNNYKVLLKNIENKKNIISINKAIWNKVDKVSIENNYFETSSQTFKISKKNGLSDVVPTTTIKNIIDDHKINKIDILKIDIEGSESVIFDDSAAEWIKSVNMIIIECPDNDSPFATNKIFQSFSKNNLKFKTYINGENFVFINEKCSWKSEVINFY